MSTTGEIPHGGSPETQEIINVCYGGTADGWQRLEQLVPARQQAAEKALESFLAQADQQGPDFVKAHDATLQGVENAFARYQEVLEAILKAARAKSAEQAKEAAGFLAVTSFGIRSAVIAFEESFLSYGDSRFPLINLLSNLFDRFRGGQVPVETWRSTCQRYGQFFANSVEEIDKSEEAGKPGVPERRAALQRLTELLGQLERMESSTSLSAFEDQLFAISGLLVELTEAVETYHNHAFLTGESSSPRINLILNVAKGTLEGKYDRSILRALTTSMSDEIQGRLKELDRLSQETLDSQVLSDCLGDMIDVLESLDDALESLIRVANGEKVDPAEVQEALDILRESGDNLGEVNRAVAQVNEKQSSLTCPGCGTTQEPGRRSCLSCGAALPELSASAVASSFEMEEGRGEAALGEPVMTTVMQELFSKVEDFDAARMEADAYLDLIEEYHQKIDLSEQKLSTLQPPDMPEDLSVEDRALCREFITIADDGLSLLEVGLAECREGLEHLQHFGETREAATKKSGMQLFFDGTQKLWLVNRAQKRVEEFIKASGSNIPGGTGSTSGPMSAPTSLASRFQDHLP